MTDFDEYFQTSADTASIPHHYDKFWLEAIESLKKFPLNLKVTRKKNKIFNKYAEFEVLFDSLDKYQIAGKLYLPIKSNYKPPIIIRFPDYMKEEVFIPELYDEGFGQFIIELRGYREAITIQEASEDKQKASFGYFAENMDHPEDYYMKKLYLDAIRSVEVIRLIKEIDKNKIAIWGKGIGAAMAVFLQHHEKRISSLILEEPCFVYLELTQNISKAPYAEEINQFIKKNKMNKKKLKENLAFFDVIYLAEKINVPVTMLINIEKKDLAPQGGFALFHKIPENKDMIISPTLDDSSPEYEKKILSEAIKFFNETLK